MIADQRNELSYLLVSSSSKALTVTADVKAFQTHLLSPPSSKLGAARRSGEQRGTDTCRVSRTQGRMATGLLPCDSPACSDEPSGH